MIDLASWEGGGPCLYCYVVAWLVGVFLGRHDHSENQVLWFLNVLLPSESPLKICGGHR